MTEGTSEESAVLQDLFPNSNTKSRPVKSLEDTVKVYMSITINQILDLVSEHY